MKKPSIKLVVANVLILVTFILISFIAPFVRNDSFWVGFSFEIVSIGVFLFSSLFILSAEGIKKKVYRIPVLYFIVSYVVIQTIITIVLYTTPTPYWLGMILCVILLVFVIIGLLMANTGEDVVLKIDAKVKEKRFFIEDNMIVLKTLQNKIRVESSKEALAKLIEDLRFSDPISSDFVKTEDEQITKLIELMADNENLETNIAEVRDLLSIRNAKIKSAK